MSVKVVWTLEAESLFTKNIYYLRDQWSEKEVGNFITQTEKIIDRIKKHPESFPQGVNSKSYRRARLNKYIVLFYKYYKAQKKVVLLTFWNTKQDLSKLKYK